MASHSLIEPNGWVMARLPNGTTRLLQAVPNTSVQQHAPPSSFSTAEPWSADWLTRLLQITIPRSIW